MIEFPTVNSSQTIIVIARTIRGIIKSPTINPLIPTTGSSLNTTGFTSNKDKNEINKPIGRYPKKNFQKNNLKDLSGLLLILLRKDINLTFY